jgi:hypothetical protein
MPNKISYPFFSSTSQTNMENYKEYGFAVNQTVETMNAFRANFFNLPDRVRQFHPEATTRIGNRIGKLNIYLGIEQLRAIIGPPETEPTFDGLKLCFALLNPSDALVNSYELILTRVKLNTLPNGTIEERPGNSYWSVDEFQSPVSLAEITPLRQHFQQMPGHGEEFGTYVGLNQLKRIIDEANRDGYNLLDIQYGIDITQPGDAEYGKHRIIMRLVKLGSIYISVTTNSTNPPGLGCPPLSCAPPDGF